MKSRSQATAIVVGSAADGDARRALNLLEIASKKARYKLDARVHGGPRANVNIGLMEGVMALDVYPSFLVRAIEAGDLEEALSLGLLEVTEEDVALCTFADASKLDVGAVVRKGLDLYEKEG